MFGIDRELKIHFVGIGGIGMSGIAEILINLGYSVSGSDISQNANVQKLKSLGATIFNEHIASNIDDVQILVYSSAIKKDNPEIMKAVELKIPIIQRAEMLAELMRLKFGIAVAGSHGKTTTTSFLSTILKECKLNPTCIVGGIVKNLGGHALKGDSEYLVAEADESDGSFLYLNPIMSVITNIDNDHLDYYKTEEKLEQAFEDFVNKAPFYGKVALNIEDKKSKELISKIKRPYLTYGLSSKAEYYASDIVFNADGSEFNVNFNGEKFRTKISLSGEHNVLNALSAIAIAHQLKLSLGEICEAIAKFEGVGRRFEIIHNEDFIVVDDYGHHPTEIAATLKTAKQKYPDRNIVSIFEPHRFTRTQEHWDDFVNSFSEVSKVYVAPIYAASEKQIEDITSEKLVKAIDEKFGNAEFMQSWDKIEELFEVGKKENLVILGLGAGSISKVMRTKVEKWISK